VRTEATVTPPPADPPRTAGRACAVCGAPLELAYAAVEAEVARVRVRIDRAPYLACSADAAHPRREVSDPAADEGATGRATVAAREQLTVAQRPLLPWRPARCAACGAGLTMPGFRSERAVTVTGGGAPATTLALDLPLWRCPECAVENVPREAWADAVDAIAAALAERDIG
jgi:hypothetical protein